MIRSGNPEGYVHLERAAQGGNVEGAYLLGLRLYNLHGAIDKALRWIRLVEGDEPNTETSNKACVCVGDKVRQECAGAWQMLDNNMAEWGEPYKQLIETMFAILLEEPRDGQECKMELSCGNRKTIDECTVYCSERCRIRYELHCLIYSLHWVWADE